MTATNDKSIHFLALLETGFRTDAAHLKELEKDLAETLHLARFFGKKHGSPEDWNTKWHQSWSEVERSLLRIKTAVNEVDAAIESSDPDRLAQATEACAGFLVEDMSLVEELNAIRTQVLVLNSGVRKDWNHLAHKLQTHFETIHACAQALRIKLELLKKYPKAEVEQLVQEVLSKLPSRSQAEEMTPEQCAEEYRKAATELELEHHKFTGFMDLVKGMFMWVESPETRMEKNLQLVVDEA